VLFRRHMHARGESGNPRVTHWLLDGFDVGFAVSQPAVFAGHIEIYILVLFLSMDPEAAIRLCCRAASMKTHCGPSLLEKMAPKDRGSRQATIFGRKIY
jgi:hypothetical protein